ncbi:MAG: formate dehydrogenase subunit alpha [Holophagaceae bacterium]|nr:formate dehydrogenase subunit alpha [Holophagaceae bacterium]
MTGLALTVNDRRVTAEPGDTLLTVLSRQGLEVPTLCHDPRLKPASLCRMCEVEVGRRCKITCASRWWTGIRVRNKKTRTAQVFLRRSLTGQERNLCACSTVAEPGMVVRTHTPELEDYRRGVLAMMARDYPSAAVDAHPHEPFHRWLRHYGVAPAGKGDPDRLDTTHPYIRVDLSQCIECYRCVRICEELQGQFVWKAIDRGGSTHVAPGFADSLLHSPCVSCGACVDTCPTGALEDASHFVHGIPDSWTSTTCPYCGVGCGMEIGVKDGRIASVRPLMDSPVNAGHLCVKGRYGTGIVDAPDRVAQPAVRRNGEWVQVSWDEALDEAAAAIRRIREMHGPDAIGFLGSSRATNEDSYLVQKLARVVVGTNNVDCCARVCHAPSAAGLGQVFGTGAATNSFEDIEKAALIMIVGANPTENHPIVGNRIKQRALAGIPLIVIDPRRIELAGHASVHLAPRPGTNLPLLLAMAQVILAEGLEDRPFLEARTENLEAFRTAAEEWPPERAAQVCGVGAESIRQAARLYASTRPALAINGLGLTEQIQGTEGVMALAQLALLTGNIGKPGSGVNPLRGQNNVQGSANMGCEPSRLTGYQPIAAARELHEQVWGVPIPETAGLSVMGMVDAAFEGRLKGMVVFGYDVLLSNPDAHRTAEALGRLNAMVVVDLFMTETAKAFGTVFLPVASSFEKEGTFMNGERRVQRVRAAIPLHPGVKTDLEVACLLGQRLGFADHFAFLDAGATDAVAAEAVWEEIRQVWPVARGITYPRIESVGIQWPCPSEDHPGTTVLHAGRFPKGPRAAFRALAYRPSAEIPTAEFPLLMNTGRTLYHFNAATMTGRTRNRELQRDDWIQIHPQDAGPLGIADGGPVVVETRHGQFPAHAWITDVVRPGECFGVFHNPEAFVNRATGQGRDNFTETPEYKVTAARIRPS